LITLNKNNNGTNDEVHAVVVDANGTFTGTVGEVLETYPFVSGGTNAKNPDGTNNWANKSVVCTSKSAANLFYEEQKLYPLLGGAGQAWSSVDRDWFPTATFVLINEEGGMAVMEYHQDGTVCSLSFGHNIIFDTDELRGYME